MIRPTGIFLTGISINDHEALLRKIFQEELASHFINFPLKKDKEEEELITKKAAAQFLKCSLPTLSALVRDGIIPCHRLGSNIRFLKSEILASLSIVRNKKHDKYLTNK
ncbi:MAG: helix-turn-helix domain-containing protein [Chitinophagaceae bacterium]